MPPIYLEDMGDDIRFDGLPGNYKEYWFDDLDKLLYSVLAPRKLRGALLRGGRQAERERDA